MSAPACATQIKIYIGNGTGFYVSREGHIVTNQHVVSYCKRLTVTGAEGTREASVIARDQANDLALLKVAAMNAPFGTFSSRKVSLATGDRAVIIGFPGAQMTPVVRESEIIRPEVPGSDGKWLGLGDVLEQGNSGGPLLDTSGNIIGVVSAKAMLLTYNKATHEEIERQNFGAAIALPIVEKFLERNGVDYQTADTDVYLPTEHIAADAREYIVKVQCEYKTEIRN